MATSWLRLRAHLDEGGHIDEGGSWSELIESGKSLEEWIAGQRRAFLGCHALDHCLGFVGADGDDGMFALDPPGDMNGRQFETGDRSAGDLLLFHFLLSQPDAQTQSRKQGFRVGAHARQNEVDLRLRRIQLAQLAGEDEAMLAEQGKQRSGCLGIVLHLFQRLGIFAASQRLDGQQSRGLVCNLSNSPFTNDPVSPFINWPMLVLE